MEIAKMWAWFTPHNNRFHIGTSHIPTGGLVHELGHTRTAWGEYFDPIVFEDWDDAIDLALDLTMFRNTFLEITPNVQPLVSTTTLRIDAHSTIPNLADLFETAIIAAYDTNGPVLDVSFSSNPLLGLDDNAIKTLIAAAFTYDFNDGGFVVTDDTSILTLAIDIPEGTDAFTIEYNNGTVAEHFAYGGIDTPTPGFCGDSIVQPLLGEQCDPPYAGKLCNKNCQIITNCAELIQAGGNIAADLNGDCYIDLRDLSIVAGMWLGCFDPADPTCALMP